MNNFYPIVIGIDPGTQSGVAIWNAKEQYFISISSMRIWDIFILLRHWDVRHQYSVYLIIEDPTEVKFGTSPSKAQGAGAVKWCFRQIRDYAKEWGIPFEARRPNKKITKLSADVFGRMTGWKHRTNEHGRDAAMLVYQHSGRVLFQDKSLAQ